MLVTFNAAGLSAGASYQANLTITSNDPDEPQITVPVTLRVKGGGVRLYLTPASLPAGVGSTFTLDVMVDAGAQPVNNVELYLTFNPALLRVVDASGNPATSRSRPRRPEHRAIQQRGQHHRPDPLRRRQAQRHASVGDLPGRDHPLQGAGRRARGTAGFIRRTHAMSSSAASRCWGAQRERMSRSKWGN